VLDLDILGRDNQVRHSRTSTWVVLLAVLTSTMWSPSPIRAVQPVSQVATAVGQLLDQSGYTYTKHSDTVWSINRRGNYLSEFKVVIGTGNDLMVTFVTVAKKAQLKRSEDLLFMLLRLDHEFDYVKVGLDDDQDLFVRVDSSPRLLDLQEFKATVEQVAKSADEVYGKVRPFLNTP
jgi:hypothetical protein